MDTLPIKREMLDGCERFRLYAREDGRFEIWKRGANGNWRGAFVMSGEKMARKVLLDLRSYCVIGKEVAHA